MELKPRGRKTSCFGSPVFLLLLVSQLFYWTCGAGGNEVASLSAVKAGLGTNSALPLELNRLCLTAWARPRNYLEGLVGVRDVWGGSTGEKLTSWWKSAVWQPAPDSAHRDGYQYGWPGR